MSIEKSSPSASAKAVTGADPHGKKGGKAPDTSAGNGFSALMNMLSAAEDIAVVPVVDSVLGDFPLADQAGPQSEAALPGDSGGMLALALPPVSLLPAVKSDSALPTVTATHTAAASKTATETASETATILASELPQTAIPISAPSTAALSLPALAQVSVTVGVTSIPSSTSAASDELPTIGLAQRLSAPVVAAPQQSWQADEVVQTLGGMPFQPLAATKGLSTNNQGGVQQAKVGDSAALQAASLRQVAKAATGDGNAIASAAPDLSQMTPVSALLAHRGMMQAQGAQLAQQDMKDIRAADAPQLAVVAADVFVTALAGAAGEVTRSQGRFGAKAGLGQSGSSGFENAFGQTMAATHRSDAVFELPPASAVVADTAVAETVSYWASQGVQTAEMELEGFGDSPVEVSIVLNGDQAQIDFRTDQAGVRQVLEAATAQLKELLSNQGLQLAGVSVGTSAKGSEQGGERRARQGAQQTTLVKTEAVGSASTRMANPAMGRSLDLFV